MQPFVLPYAGVSPRFAGPPAAGPGAAVLGRVAAGRGLRLGAGAVIRADGHDVRVGEDFRLGRHGTVHIAHDRYPTHIGTGVSAGQGAVIHACEIGDGCWLGRAAIVLDGSTVAAGAALADEAVVFPRSELEGGWLHAGLPAKPLRRLAPGELDALHGGWRDMAGAGVAAVSSTDLLFVAATAVLAGTVRGEGGVGIWFGCRLEATPGRRIEIGADTNIQDNSRVAARGADVRIGRRVTLGHNVTLEDSTVGDDSLVGIGATVAPGTVVERDVLLAAGAVTEAGQRLESGWLYGGRPAVRLKPLDEERRALIAGTWPRYGEYARAFAAAQAAAA